MARDRERRDGKTDQEERDREVAEDDGDERRDGRSS